LKKLNAIGNDEAKRRNQVSEEIKEEEPI